MNCDNSKIITDDFIFNLELFHDNKDNISFIKNQIYFYDTIKEKKIDVITNIKNPEEVIKDLIFQDISYQKICFKNENFKKEIIDIEKQDFILIFDNMQLKSHIYKIICDIIFQKSCNIFIPFIYIAEQSINNEINYIEMIKKYKNKYGDKILMDEYIDTSGNIKNEYIKISNNIGLCFINNNVMRLINYNPFESDMTDKNRDKIIKELIYLDKYFTSLNKKSIFFTNIIQEAYGEYAKYFYTNGNFDPHKLNNITNKIYNNLIHTKKLIISFKEARDTYYIEEIKLFAQNNTTKKMLYITSDEISCIRCILNNISALNIYGENIRYFCYVDNNDKQKQIFLKLYNILHILNPKNISTEIYKNNSQLILKESKALISKIIYNHTGGFDIIQNEPFIVIDTDKNLHYVRSYIEYINSKTSNFYSTFMKDIYKSIEMFTLKDTMHMNVLDEIYDIIANLEVIDENYILDDYMKIDFTEKSQLYNSYYLKMRYIRLNKNLYEEFINKPVNKKNILIGWFISRFIFYDSLTPKILDYIERYFLPNVFTKYNIYDTMMWMNIDTIEYKFKKYIEYTIVKNEINVDDDEEKEMYTFDYDNHMLLMFDNVYKI